MIIKDYILKVSNLRVDNFVSEGMEEKLYYRLFINNYGLKEEYIGYVFDTISTLGDIDSLSKTSHRIKNIRWYTKSSIMFDVETFNTDYGKLIAEYVGVDAPYSFIPRFWDNRLHSIDFILSSKSVNKINDRQIKLEKIFEDEW